MLAVLHIPKTGGTSLRSMIRASGAEVLDINSFADAQAFAARPAAVRAACAVAFGHMARGIHTVMPPGTVRYAAFLREPVGRLASAYLHCARTPLHPYCEPIRTGEMTFETFAMAAQANDNNQVRRLAHFDWFDGQWWLGIPDGHVTRRHLDQAKKTLRECLFVGLYEHFAADAHAFADRAGFRFPAELAHLNVTAASLEIPASVRSRIADRHALDIELHEFAANLRREAEVAGHEIQQRQR